MALNDLNKIVGTIEPMPDVILARDMENGYSLTKSGLIILDDNGKDPGIRPRWTTVYKVGSNVTDVKPGDYILVEHGRWTHIIEIEEPKEDGTFETVKMQRIDPNGIYMVCDTRPDMDSKTYISNL